MSPRRAIVGAGVVAGAVGLAAGGLWALERTVVRRTRARTDHDRLEDLVLPPGTTESFPSHDGGTIATFSVGSGPPIVLSHGVTLSNRVWAKQLRTLPELGFRAVAFDHRGHGDSRVGDTGHSVDNLGDDVRTMLEALDLRGAVIVGHSMGGVAVQSYVARHPEHAAEHLAGIVLLSTLARVRFSEMRRFHRLIDLAGEHAPGLGSLLARPDLGFAVARLGFGADPAPSHVELTRQMIAACDPATIRLAGGALLTLDISDALTRISLPTLVVCGTADLLTPPAESRRIASLVPGARLELFPKAGHMLMLERGDALDELLAGFAREVGAVAGASVG